MIRPALLFLPTEVDYRIHFNNCIINSNVTTRHDIRVNFDPESFDHAFYESTNRNKVKDVFSKTRANRMSWIIPTLNDSSANWFKGWFRRKYDVTRAVATAYDNFVVILEFRINRSSILVAKFITCYEANNSIRKIRSSPAWDLEECWRVLGSGRGR